jgi:hypothetical protein
MRHVRAIVALVAVAALTVPAAASADTNPTRVSPASTASWISPQQINLEVAVTCDEGLFFGLSARVLQQQGPFMQVLGSGFTNGQCTGRRQKVALSIWAFQFPGWQLGDAIASVSACAFTCDSADRSIRIDL